MSTAWETILAKIERNPTGRGRPYRLDKLVRDVLELPKIPRRVTINLRLRVDEVLSLAGVESNVLDTSTRQIRLRKK